MTNSSDTPADNQSCTYSQFPHGINNILNNPCEQRSSTGITSTEASTCSQRVSLATSDSEANTSTTTPTSPPPPPQAFSSLSLHPGALLSSSYSPVGTTSSSRMYEQSKNLGYVPTERESTRRLVSRVPTTAVNTKEKGLDEDDNQSEKKTNTESSLPTVSDEKNIDPIEEVEDKVQSAHGIDSNAARPDLGESSCSEEDSKEVDKKAVILTDRKDSAEKGEEQISCKEPTLTQNEDDREYGEPNPSISSPHPTQEGYCASADASENLIPLHPVPRSKPRYDSDLLNEDLLMSKRETAKRMGLGLITASGASSPSVLSSEDSEKRHNVGGKDTEEVKRREENRINHLNLLLEMHCQNEKRKADLNLAAITKIDSSGSEGDGEKPKKKKNRQPQSLQGKSDGGSFKTGSTKTSTRLTSSHMLSDVIQRNFNPTAIFENFEKNWTSPYPTPLSSNAERVCFASAVVILLGDNCALPSSTPPSKGGNARNGKLSQSTIEVPLQVVKLFWKKTVLPTLGISTDDADVMIENIVEKLFDKLRYLVLVPVLSTASSLSPHVDIRSKNLKAAVHLSHDVYGEYAKYIMDFDDTMQHQVGEWRSSFITILENIFTAEMEENAPIDIRRYAAISLPQQIVSLWKFLNTNSSPLLADEIHREYAEKFVKIMTNSHFLSWRMVVFGDGMKIDGSLSVEYSGKRKKVKRKVTSSDFVRNHWDLLNASSLHVKDLEYFMTTFYATGADSEVDSDVTNTFLSMYNAWKIQCLEVLKIAKKRLSLDDSEHVFGRKNDKKVKKLSSSSPTRVTNVINDCEVASVKSSYVDPGSSAIMNSSINKGATFFSNDSREKRSHVQRNAPKKKYKASKDLAYVRHLASCTDGLPAQYKALPGEFTIDPKMNLVSLKKITPVRDPKSGLRPLPRVRVLHNSSRMISKSPVMRLSDILAIDLRVLYLQVTLGKVMAILSQSIASGIDCRVNKTELFQVTSNPLLTMTKVKYTSESIEICSRTMNILSFLLSEDLVQVDEDDLTDLGYHDNGKGSLPSRIKKLRNDRKEGNGLLGQLRILCAESWFNIGKILCDGAKSGRSTAVEMAKISITSLPLDISYSNNGQQCQDRKVGCDEPEKLQNKVLHCYQFSLSLLRQNSNTAVNSETSSFSSRSKSTSRSYDDKVDNTSIGFYKRTLLASIIHSIGVHYYAQVGNLETAKLCLHEALSRRRLLLRQLQKESNDITNTSVSSINDSSNQSLRRSLEYGTGAKSTRNDRKIRKKSSNLRGGSCGHDDLLFACRLGKKEQIDKMELELSYTLEFAALTSHSHLDHQTSISFFQEAIILRALHVGKNSPDVARLHYNMGVIHDDLGQHEASLSRYGKSLKVRLSKLERFNMRNDFSKPSKILKSTAFSDINDLEATVVLTLRCMGNVYRALQDSTNALCCYMKAIELLKTKLKRIATASSFGIYQGSSDFELGFGKGIGSKAVDLPIPDSNMDELQQHDAYIPPTPILSLLGDESREKLQPFGNKTTLSESDKIRKDIANMYSTVVSLVNDRKQEDDPSTIGTGRSGYLSAGGYSSGGYGSGYGGSVCSGHSRQARKVSKPSKASGKDYLDGNASDDVILLHAAFNLGMLTMHFGEYQNAMCYFEEAFRTIWTSMGCGDASDSDISSKMSSMASSREKGKSSKSSMKTGVEGQVEEGIVYHAMAVAHAALSEHERAVRCYLTALRYYRRRRGMDSVKVAGALYDCGSSYWHLGDYIKAEEFWADCFRIIFCEGKDILEKRNSSSALANSCASDVESKDFITKKSKDDTVQVEDAEYARILHNLGNVHLQNGHLDIASQCYEEALAIRRKLLNMKANDHTKLTQLCEFNVSRGINHEKLRDMANTLHNLGWLYEMQCIYEKALSCLNQALFIKQNLSKHIEKHKRENEEKKSVTIVPRHDETNLGKTLSCAITLLRIGSVHVKIYNHDIGLSYYRAALSIQKSELGKDHIAVARTLFDMGQIANHHTDASGLNKDAMTCFNEALRIAKLQFGQHHYAVAGVMYDIGSIHDKSGNDFDAITYYRNSVSVYGRIYAKSLLRRFCFVPIFRNVSSGKNSSHEGFNPAGLGDQYSMENRARSTVQQAAAIEDGKDKELFIRASIALTTVAERSGRMNEYTLLGFELSFWKFVEGLAASGMESIRARVRKFLLAFVNHFEKVSESEHIVVRSQQTISDSFFHNVWN